MEKTTIVLREDVKQALLREFGKRKMSEIINDLLFKEFILKENKNIVGELKESTKKGGVVERLKKQRTLAKRKRESKK